MPCNSKPDETYLSFLRVMLLVSEISSSTGMRMTLSYNLLTSLTSWSSSLYSHRFVVTVMYQACITLMSLQGCFPPRTHLERK